MPLPTIPLQRLDGSEFPGDALQGKVLLVVNVASRCGFTPQYTGLEALHRQFGEQGLVILGFPCDQFGHQEPGDAEEIARFCSLDYPVSFPLMAKCEVNREQGKKFIETLKVFSHLANVGDCRSLVIHPASTTHFRMSDDALAGAGISQGTIRLSIGLEDADDLIDDLKRALKAAEKAGA